MRAIAIVALILLAGCDDTPRRGKRHPRPDVQTEQPVSQPDQPQALRTIEQKTAAARSASDQRRRDYCAANPNLMWCRNVNLGR